MGGGYFSICGGGSLPPLVHVTGHTGKQVFLNTAASGAGHIFFLWDGRSDASLHPSRWTVPGSTGRRARYSSRRSDGPYQAPPEALRLFRGSVKQYRSCWRSVVGFHGHIHPEGMR